MFTSSHSARHLSIGVNPEIVDPVQCRGFPRCSQMAFFLPYSHRVYIRGGKEVMKKRGSLHRVVGSNDNLIRAVLGVVLGAALIIPGMASSSEITYLGKLRVGQGVVVTGPHLEREAVFWETCEISGPCFQYSVDVTEEASFMRVFLNPIDHFDLWGYRLRSPSGANFEMLKVDPTSELGHSHFNPQEWTYELPIPDPELGRWEILVVPLKVIDSAFRLRVQLDADPEPITSPQLPNLRIVPPFELTFAAPVQPLTLVDPLPYFNAGLPLEVAEKPLLSCMPEETASKQVTRCLRFSLGFGNFGEGPLDLRFNRDQVMGTMQQKIRGDETVYEGPEYELHESHHHFHNRDFGQTEVFRVVPTKRGRGKPNLVQVGKSIKESACLIDNLIADINSSLSAHKGAESGSCDVYGLSAEDPGAGRNSEGRMVLNEGWVDVYGWYLPEQYVGFDGLGDGDYVIRSSIDPDGKIIESDEGDNVGYTRIIVVGDSIEVRERGWGTSPWDPHKRLLPSNGWAL